MKLTLRFECGEPIDQDTTREISARNRTPEDLNVVIERWKQAYEKKSGESPRVVLCGADTDVSLSPAEIDAIDEVQT